MDFGYIIPDEGKAIYSVMCSNADTGKQSEIIFRLGGKTDFIRTDEVAMQFIYSEGDFFVCMNQESFEQLHIQRFCFPAAYNF